MHVAGCARQRWPSASANAAEGSGNSVCPLEFCPLREIQPDGQLADQRWPNEMPDHIGKDQCRDFAGSPPWKQEAIEGENGALAGI